MSKRQERRARVAALQNGDPVAAQARAEGNQARALEMRRAREAAANHVAAGGTVNLNSGRIIPADPNEGLREPRSDEPYLPLKGLAVSGRGGGGRLSQFLIPLLLAEIEAEERRQR